MSSKTETNTKTLEISIMTENETKTRGERQFEPILSQLFKTARDTLADLPSSIKVEKKYFRPVGYILNDFKIPTNRIQYQINN